MESLPYLAVVIVVDQQLNINNFRLILDSSGLLIIQCQPIRPLLASRDKCILSPALHTNVLLAPLLPPFIPKLFQ
jgi:hypothetical protein